MNCVSCGAEISEGASFCGKCGTRMAANRFCCMCGASMRSDATFCPSCGARQDATDGRDDSKGVRAPTAVKATTKSSKKAKQKSGGNPLGRIFIALIGLLLLLFGLSQQLLLVIGESTTGTVTDVTIESDDDDPTERYYNVGYRFSVDGTSYNGHYTMSVGSGRAPSKGNSVKVAYLSFMPSVNSRDDGMSLGVTGIIMMAFGALLIFLQFRK